MRRQLIRAALAGLKNNWKGWLTNRKIVVFESDDWGSIRMPSHESYQWLVKNGYPIAQRPQERYDALESADDLQDLFDVLTSFTDFSGRHPTFTFNTIMTNPDFAKIKAAGYTRYFGEPFTETYQKYAAHQKSFKTFQRGIKAGVFYPQYHGNEHINIARWMKQLQNEDSDSRKVFHLGMAGITAKQKPKLGNQILVAYDFDSEQQRQAQISSLVEGAKHFESLFGFRSKSFIAPVYTWHSSFEKELSKIGIKYLQGGKIQIQPQGANRRHFLGEKNIHGQSYLVRNVYFEPALHTRDIVGQTLDYIGSAFLMRKPVIISSHRFNYVGFIDKQNKKKGLCQLKRLLQAILKRWPDVEFMTSPELGELIEK